MGILDGLALGAISGAGEAIQKNSLLNQQADLDVQKAQTIAEKTAALADQQRQDHANQFLSVANNLADHKKSELLGKLASEYDMSDGKPLAPDDLQEEDRAKYDAISPYHPEIIKQAGLQTGYIKPEDAVKNDLTAEKMQNLNQYWQGKLDNARDANDMKLTLANMKADLTGQSKTALAAGIGSVSADIRASTSLLNQLQRDQDFYLSNNDRPQDPEKAKIYDKKVADFKSDIKDVQQSLKDSKEEGKLIRHQLGLNSPVPKSDPIPDPPAGYVIK